jgi:hypothetical protein
VRATTSLVLADFTSAPVTQESYVLVIPWKLALVLAAASALWRLLAKRRRKPQAKVVPVFPAAEPAKAA